MLGGNERRPKGDAFMLAAVIRPQSLLSESAIFRIIG